MGKLMGSLMKAAKSQTQASGKPSRAARLVFQGNRVVNQLRAKKVIGTTREAAKLTRLFKEG